MFIRNELAKVCVIPNRQRKAEHAELAPALSEGNSGEVDPGNVAGHHGSVHSTQSCKSNV